MWGPVLSIQLSLHTVIACGDSDSLLEVWLLSSAVWWMLRKMPHDEVQWHSPDSLWMVSRVHVHVQVQQFWDQCCKSHPLTYFYLNLNVSSSFGKHRNLQNFAESVWFMQVLKPGVRLIWNCCKAEPIRVPLKSSSSQSESRIQMASH